MIAVVWQVEIHEGKSAEFEKLYGSSGEWTMLSRRSRSFLISSFLRDLASGGWSDCVSGQRDDGQRLSAKRHELDLVGSAIPVHQDYRARIALAEPLFRDITSEGDGVKLLDHGRHISTETP